MSGIEYTPSPPSVVKSDAPLPEPPAVNILQGGKPCHPLAIHDRYPPIGTKPKEPPP